MALLDSEIERIKFELGYNLLKIGAVPYVQHLMVFEQVIQPNLLGGAITKSSTTVTATTPPVPTPVTLTLVDATGFSDFDKVYVDQDAKQEWATVQSVVGNTITVILSKSHTGTYPVTVEGGESIVREILSKLATINGPGGILFRAISSAGVKQVDEIELFPNGGYAGGSKSKLQEIQDMVMRYRDELASAVGFPNLRRYRNAGGRMELY